MSSYWKNYFDAISKQFDGSPLKQVGKTINGQEVSKSHVKVIVDNITKVLQLNVNDSVVDLCCGNGIITRQLAPLAKEVVGVDFSSGLIEAAKKYNGFRNIEYIKSDVLSLDPKHYSGFKKIVMYEALQLFSEQQFCVLLDQLKSLASGSLIFFGSIPNKEQFNVYYDTEEKIAFHMQRESEGRPHMGRWWLMNEIDRLVSTCGFKVIFLPQIPTLYTAYYRFDFLVMVGSGADINKRL